MFTVQLCRSGLSGTSGTAVLPAFWGWGQVCLTPVVGVQVSVPRWKVWEQRVVVVQVWLLVGYPRALFSAPVCR